MKTTGEILRKKRLEKNIKLEDAEKATKIRLRYLLALEDDDFKNLPAATFVKGFIKNYSTYLDLNSDQLLAIYRRQSNEDGKDVEVQRPIKNSDSRLKFTPNFAIFFAITLIVVVFFSYILKQILSYTSSPSLFVSSPKNNLVIKQQTLEVAGKTDPDSEIFINGQKVQLQTDGSFKESIFLNPGANTITILSVSKDKKEKTIKRTVRVEQ